MPTFWLHLEQLLGQAVCAASCGVLPLIGSHRKTDIDQAAVDAIQETFDAGRVAALVAVCEGTKDSAPMFAVGAQLGPGAIRCELAIDPIDGTTAAATNSQGAVAIIAAAPIGSLARLDATAYCDKIVVGPTLSGQLDLGMSPTERVRVATRVLGRSPSVAVLRRERNTALLAELQSTGATVALLEHSDVSASLATCLPTNIDVVMGIGGAPETAICAAALRCLGGEIQCRLWARSAAEERRLEMAASNNRTLRHDDLAPSGPLAFAAAGVTTTFALGDVHPQAIPFIVGSVSETGKRRHRVEVARCPCPRSAPGV